MNCLDKQIIIMSLENLGLKLLACHCKIEENERTIRKYIPLIVKRCVQEKRNDIKKDIIQNGLLSLSEFHDISSKCFKDDLI